VAFGRLKKPPSIVDMSYYVTNENSVLNINNAHLKVSGNVMTDVMKLGAIEFAPPASDVGGTVNFTNVTTGVTTSSNLSVGGTLSLGTVEVVATTHTLANTTANGNVTPHTVQFSNATTGIVTTANVEVGGELAVTGNVSDLNVVSNVNMLHTSNTAALKLNSNVVTEFQRSKKLIKYPRVALTSASQTVSGYEGHFVSQTTGSKNGTSNRQAWALFDNVLREKSGHAGPHFVDSTVGYDSNGDYTRGDSLGGVSGDWAYIRLPDKIQLQSVDLWARYDSQRNPIDATVLGSLNGTNWNVIGSWTGATFTAGESTSFTINSIQYYDYIGFVFEKIEAGSSGTYVNIHEIELYGTPEYDPEAHGTDVTIKSYPNVPNTDWLEVYYDAKDLVDGAVSTAAGAITGLGGTTNNGTAYGGVTVSDGAFVFDGSGDYIESGLTINAVGTPQHTFSLWVKPSTGDMDDTNNHYLCVWGNTTAQNSWSGLALMGGKLLHAYHASGKYTSDVLFTTGNWHHIVVVIKSTIETVAIDRDADFYVDGVLYSGSYSTLGSQAGNSAYYLNWGSGTSTRVRLASLLSGGESSSSSIANFRLFNRALTSDEIWQLYAYQKEYFGHGDLGMTLKAGRLGIGTSEPRAALDVRGNLRASGLTIQTVSSTKTDTFSTTGASNHPVSPGNDVPGLAVTIHPKFANSKILVSYTVSTGAYGRAYLRIQRKQGGSTTTIAPSVGPEANTQNQGKCTTSHSGSGDSSVDSQSFEYYDTIGGTEPITYQIQAWTYHSVYYIYVNRGHDDGNGSNNGTYWARTLSSITAKEVCQ